MLQAGKAREINARMTAKIGGVLIMFLSPQLEDNRLTALSASRKPISR
jgi:hypothetical protein